MQLPEFRLYYDDKGEIVFYTCEKPEGKYIVIDLMTYHACRHDVKVVNGQLVSKAVLAAISKLVPSETGIPCHRDDVSIINDAPESIKWQLKYE